MKEIFQNIYSALEQLQKLSDRLWESQLRNHELDNLSISKNEVNDKIKSIGTNIDVLSDALDGHKVTNNFLDLLKNYLDNLNKDLQISDFVQLERQTETLRNDAEKLNFFTKIAVQKNTAVIVGANGSGKSTFVNDLGELSLPNLTVIPAQKNLYFSEQIYKRDHTDEDSYRKANLRPSNNAYKIDNSSESEAVTRLFEPFTLMITALVNEVVQLSTDERNFELSKRSVPKWDNLTKIWNKVIPDVTFCVDGVHRQVYPIRNNQQYSFNKLSDGEKCILFYIGNVLLAKDNAYVVVDEPETFLNAAIYNKLWDILISVRKDCQFIFTSHNPEFIMARRGASIFWCKQFSPPDKVELRLLDFKNNLPMDLLTELVGSRKKILFCEGTENSYDYQIFSAIFLDEYTVKPVGGHEKVIQYTKTFNALPNWVDNSAVGIVDRDGMNIDQINSLSSNEVSVLPYNEIEMLLVDEKVMRSVLQLNHNDRDIPSIVSNFKSEFRQLLIKEKERVIYTLAKSRVGSELSSQFIDSKLYKTTDSLIHMVDELPKKIHAKTIVEGCIKEVETALQSPNYDLLLKMCSLKGEIVGGLSNRYLQPDYASLAIGRIQRTSELKGYLRNLVSL